MRELARCDIDGSPTPAIPKEALSVVGVTSPTLAVAWIRSFDLTRIKRQLLTEKQLSRITIVGLGTRRVEFGSRW